MLIGKGVYYIAIKMGKLLEHCGVYMCRDDSNLPRPYGIVKRSLCRHMGIYTYCWKRTERTLNVATSMVGS